MREHTNEGGQSSRPEFKLPNFEELLKPGRAEARQALPVLEFQQPFVGEKVPKSERVPKEDFVDLVGAIVFANREVAETEYDKKFDYGVDEIMVVNGDSSVHISAYEDADGTTHQVGILTPNGGPDIHDKKSTRYTSSTMKGAKPWVARIDQPLHIRGETIKEYPSQEEIRALGDFIKTEFGLNVPGFEQDSETGLEG